MNIDDAINRINADQDRANDRDKRPHAIRLLAESAQSGELRLWPADLENVYNVIPTKPAPASASVDGVGIRIVQALEHYGFMVVRHVPVIEITAEGRAFLNRHPEGSLEDVAAELSAMLASAPVGRYRSVECGQCHTMIRIPSDIPGDWFACAACATREPR